MPGIVLWGAETPRTHRPLWVLEELGVDYIHKPIGSRTGETQDDIFTALAPKQKIPLLEHGNFVLSESVAISRYLMEVTPNTVFWRPQTSQECAREDEWCNFIYGELDETGLYVLRRHEGLPEIYGASKAVSASTRTYVEKQLETAAEMLGDNRTLMPQGFSLADILMMSCLEWAVAYQINMPEALMQYRARIAKRPAFQRSMMKNYAKRLAAMTGDQNGST